jgi:hypothetical protein
VSVEVEENDLFAAFFTGADCLINDGTDGLTRFGRGQQNFGAAEEDGGLKNGELG